MEIFRIGRHINISYGLLTAPDYAKEIGCDIFQLFLGAPQRILSKPRKKSELIEFGKKLIKLDMRMVIHGSYTINFCHRPSSTKFDASVRSLVQDLQASELIGNRCLGVIIHMGKNIKENDMDDEEAMNNYVTGLKTALEQTPSDTSIILETGASQGTEVASQIEGMAYIYWSLKKNERDRVHFCIDTCHIWASGYDISDKKGVANYFKEFEKNIGIEKIVCIHFNDSKTKLDSCVDRHEDLGYGKIKENGLKAFAIYAKKYNIPLIMETPLSSYNKNTKSDITFEEELEKVKMWIE